MCAERCYSQYQYFNIQDPSPDISNVPNVPQFNNGEEKIVLVLLFQTAAWIRICKNTNPSNYQWLEGQDVRTVGLIMLITTLTSITATRPYPDEEVKLIIKPPSSSSSSLSTWSELADRESRYQSHIAPLA